MRLAVRSTPLAARLRPFLVPQAGAEEASAGHAFLAVDHHAETGKVLVLESNASDGRRLVDVPLSAGLLLGSPEFQKQ
ncbi:hypothetical protein [Myxococcus sp. Y35]|uniref:hypothetical protein n=1 Tax=Pseudomyxococcus flavus TaxID=3115648 RepID=UPI003CF8C942